MASTLCRTAEFLSPRSDASASWTLAANSIWTVGSPILDFRDQIDVTRVSEDGKVVDFGYLGVGWGRPKI